VSQNSDALIIAGVKRGCLSFAFFLTTFGALFMSDLSVFAIFGSGTMSGALGSYSSSYAISVAWKSSSLMLSIPSRGKGVLLLSVGETMRANRMVQVRGTM
jgi:hypothetical protein